MCHGLQRIVNHWGWSVVLASALCTGVALGELPTFMQKPSPQHIRIMCYNVNWDSIFENGDHDNHPWREYDMSDQFVRVVTAIDPDIVCLQEINSYRDPQDVADILDAALPLGGGETWRAHNGSDNVIAARFDLSMLATDTIPSTNRDQAMALVDLPDATYSYDLYLMNAHFKAGGGQDDIERRQQHADAIIHWIGDIKSPGGYINLPADTPIIVLGDLNVYDTDPAYHLTTLITGDIVDQGTYGPDVPPDWDDTDNADALPLHNGAGPDFYTWRNDSGSFNPGALDRIIYTEAVISVDNSFVLNTTTMSAGDLAAAGLQANDVVLNAGIGYYDHFPLVVDLLAPGGQDEYTLTVNITGSGSIDLDPPGGTYSPDTTVELTANASTGWYFDHWEGDLSGSDNPETIAMDGNKTVTAVFTQDEYTLTVNITGSGTVTKDPDQATYTYGQNVELTATPDIGWSFDHWSGDLTGSTNPDTIAMDGDKTVTAVFTQDEYTLTVNITGSGSVSKNPDQATYTYGQNVELTATPDIGWSFDHWSGDLTGSTNPDTIAMDGDKTVTAVFTQDEYTLTVNITGSGSVSKNPDQATYTYGQSVELTANADAGWYFDHWESDLTGSTNPDTIAMDGDKTVTAVFVQDEYTLTVNIVGQGTVDLDPPGGTYPSGTMVELTANADPGWYFDHWEGDLAGSNNPEMLVMTDDMTVTVVFEADCYGDINGDGRVNLSDLAQLLSNYGMTGGATYQQGDLTGDGNVNLQDLAELLSVYGTVCW